MYSSVPDLLYRSGVVNQHVHWWRRSQRLRRVSLSSMFIVCFGLPAQAISHDGLKLIAKPDSCVALHRGQQCFTRVQLSWSLPLESEVCLHSNNNDMPLICVSGRSRSVSVAYASATSTLYSLRSKDASEILADVVVRTAWVYRTGRKSSSGWRLF